MSLKKQHKNFIRRLCSAFVAVVFIATSVSFPRVSSADVFRAAPVSAALVPLTPEFHPYLIKGLSLHPDNPLQFDFIINQGDTKLEGDSLKEEATKLVKYFLASLTVPEEELWVNLSPYEKDRIIAKGLGQTEMGRDLLAQDYLLKQLTSSLIYPEGDSGKAFWDRVYQKIKQQYGTIDVPLDTFNPPRPGETSPNLNWAGKVWIVPDKAVVYQQDLNAFVVESHLKVMLEKDYLNLQKKDKSQTVADETQVTEIIRQVIIPEIEKEVNTGKNFANLRQMYNSLILATWYKINLKESLLGKVYVDQNKTKGIDLEEKNAPQEIYQKYLETIKKGTYDFIREEYDPSSQQILPRKYFSGGFTTKYENAMLADRVKKDLINDDAMLSPNQRGALTGDDLRADVALVEEGKGAQIRLRDVKDSALLAAIGIKSETRRDLASLAGFRAKTFDRIRGTGILKVAALGVVAFIALSAVGSSTSYAGQEDKEKKARLAQVDKFFELALSASEPEIKAEASKGKAVKANNAVKADTKKLSPSKLDKAKIKPTPAPGSGPKIKSTPRTPIDRLMGQKSIRILADQVHAATAPAPAVGGAAGGDGGGQGGGDDGKGGPNPDLKAGYSVSVQPIWSLDAKNLQANATPEALLTGGKTIISEDGRRMRVMFSEPLGFGATQGMGDNNILKLDVTSLTSNGTAWLITGGKITEISVPKGDTRIVVKFLGAYTVVEGLAFEAKEGATAKDFKVNHVETSLDTTDEIPAVAARPVEEHFDSKAANQQIRAGLADQAAALEERVKNIEAWQERLELLLWGKIALSRAEHALAQARQEFLSAFEALRKNPQQIDAHENFKSAGKALTAAHTRRDELSNAFKEELGGDPNNYHNEILKALSIVMAEGATEEKLAELEEVVKRQAEFNPDEESVGINSTGEVEPKALAEIDAELREIGILPPKSKENTRIEVASSPTLPSSDRLDGSLHKADYEGGTSAINLSFKDGANSDGRPSFDGKEAPKGWSNGEQKAGAEKIVADARREKERLAALAKITGPNPETSAGNGKSAIAHDKAKKELADLKDALEILEEHAAGKKAATIPRVEPHPSLADDVVTKALLDSLMTQINDGNELARQELGIAEAARSKAEQARHFSETAAGQEADRLNDIDANQSAIQIAAIKEAKKHLNDAEEALQKAYQTLSPWLDSDIKASLDVRRAQILSKLTEQENQLDASERRRLHDTPLSSDARQGIVDLIDIHKMSGTEEEIVRHFDDSNAVDDQSDVLRDARDKQLERDEAKKPAPKTAKKKPVLVAKAGFTAGENGVNSRGNVATSPTVVRDLLKNAALSNGGFVNDSRGHLGEVISIDFTTPGGEAIDTDQVVSLKYQAPKGQGTVRLELSTDIPGETVVVKGERGAGELLFSVPKFVVVMGGRFVLPLSREEATPGSQYLNSGSFDVTGLSQVSFPEKLQPNKNIEMAEVHFNGNGDNEFGLVAVNSSNASNEERTSSALQSVSGRPELVVEHPIFTGVPQSPLNNWRADNKENDQAALVAPQRSSPGGIDFNPKLLDLQIKRNGKGIPLPLNQQPILKMNIQGFFPIIINITPINVPLFLGLEINPQPQKDQQPTNTAFNLSLGPVDRQVNLSVDRQDSYPNTFRK